MRSFMWSQLLQKHSECAWFCQPRDSARFAWTLWLIPLGQPVLLFFSFIRTETNNFKFAKVTQWVMNFVVRTRNITFLWDDKSIPIKGNKKKPPLDKSFWSHQVSQPFSHYWFIEEELVVISRVCQSQSCGRLWSVWSWLTCPNSKTQQNQYENRDLSK